MVKAEGHTIQGGHGAAAAIYVLTMSSDRTFFVTCFPFTQTGKHGMHGMHFVCAGTSSVLLPLYILPHPASYLLFSYNLCHYFKCFMSSKLPLASCSGQEHDQEERKEEDGGQEEGPLLIATTLPVAFPSIFPCPKAPPSPSPPTHLPPHPHPPPAYTHHFPAPVPLHVPVWHGARTHAALCCHPSPVLLLRLGEHRRILIRFSSAGGSSGGVGRACEWRSLVPLSMPLRFTHRPPEHTGACGWAYRWRRLLSSGGFWTLNTNKRHRWLWAPDAPPRMRIVGMARRRALLFLPVSKRHLWHSLLPLPIPLYLRSLLCLSFAAACMALAA